MRHFVTLLIGLAGIASADYGTVFETQFQLCPSGWFSNTWHFNGGTGAWIDESINGGDPPYSISASMGTQAQPPVWYFVPDGTDSLLIHIEHDLDTYSSAGGEAIIKLLFISGDSEDLFYTTIDYSGCTTSEPIDAVIPVSSPDTWIGFYIHADIATAFMASSSITWYITELSVTAAGESLSFRSDTWASIKHLL